MLKLKKLYCNKIDIFDDIKFREGLNVIFADVTKEDKNKSSHSLGKTTLVDILNFMLIKKIPHTFFLKKEIFEDFIFFLEIEYKENLFLTIRRPVKGKISIQTSLIENDFRELDEENWEFNALGIVKAKALFDDYIKILSISEKGFTYRNGLRYCLRKQTQYENTFKVNTSREPDSSWTPYLSEILAVGSEIVKKKYNLNKQVESIKNAIKEIKNIPSESAQGLEAEIAQVEAHVARMQKEVDSFDFRKSDTKINDELVNNITKNISDLNKKNYEIDQKVLAINESLQTDFSFDLNRILNLFNEVNIQFQNNIVHTYEELIELNTKMSKGRKNRLTKTKERLLKEKGAIKIELKSESIKQQEFAEKLIQRDIFEKYKKSQIILREEENRLAVLKERVTKIDTASNLSDKYQEKVVEQKETELILEKATRISENKTFKDAVKIFSELVEEVLSLQAYFFTKTNEDGNIEFKIGLKDQTSVNDGFSFTRTLSSIFDITLQVLYSKDSFFRFIYHDGLLESLDDRVKLRLINKFREYSEANKLQLIISVLDSDIPLDESGNKTYFKDEEIILKLNDKGPEGRLFKMSAF